MTLLILLNFFGDRVVYYRINIKFEILVLLTHLLKETLPPTYIIYYEKYCVFEQLEHNATSFICFWSTAPGNHNLNMIC